MTAVHTIHEHGAIWQSSAYSAAPTHIRMKLAKSPNPVILLDAKAPYGIVAANAAWQEQCGFGTEALGKSPKILHGELTDMKKVGHTKPTKLALSY